MGDLRKEIGMWYSLMGTLVESWMIMSWTGHLARKEMGTLWKLPEVNKHKECRKTG